MIESHLAMDFLLLPSRTWARPRLVVCRLKETVARGGRSFRSNTKPAGFARPEVVAPRFPGAIMNRRTVILARALVVALVLGAIGAYVAWPRHADLRGFEPADIHRTAGDRDVARLLREALCRAVRPSLRTIADAVRLLAAGQLPDRAIGGAGRQGVPADAFPRGGQRRVAAARDLLPLACNRHARRLRCRGGGAAWTRLVAGEARSRGPCAVRRDRRPRRRHYLRQAGGRPVAPDIRHRPRRGDGLSRRARAGDDGSGLVGDRVPRRRLPVPEGGGGGRQPLTYCRPFLVAQLLRDTKKPRTMTGLLSC